MRPRRNHHSTSVFLLPGGNEDSDLWVTKTADGEGQPIILSLWQPTDEERARIAAGENIQLAVWGTGHPPVCLDVVDYPLGKAPEPVE